MQKKNIHGNSSSDDHVPTRPSQSTCLSSQPIRSLYKTMKALRNGPVPCPPAPGAIAICLDLSAVPKHIRTSRVVLDPLHSLFELPCTAVRGQDFRVQQHEHTSLSMISILSTCNPVTLPVDSPSKPHRPIQPQSSQTAVSPAQPSPSLSTLPTHIAHRQTEP